VRDGLQFACVLHYIVVEREGDLDMPSLQVREMPAVLYGTLQEHAKREHRSLAQQAVVTLARGMDLIENPAERRREILRRIKASAIVSAELPDAAEMVKEDRAR